LGRGRWKCKAGGDGDVSRVGFGRQRSPHQSESFVQKWRILMRAMEKTKVEGMTRRVINYVEEFKPNEEDVSDVFLF
jgi:hypothetical protein